MYTILSIKNVVITIDIIHIACTLRCRNASPIQQVSKLIDSKRRWDDVW